MQRVVLLEANKGPPTAKVVPRCRQHLNRRRIRTYEVQKLALSAAKGNIEAKGEEDELIVSRLKLNEASTCSCPSLGPALPVDNTSESLTDSM